MNMYAAAQYRTCMSCKRNSMIISIPCLHVLQKCVLLECKYQHLCFRASRYCIILYSIFTINFMPAFVCVQKTESKCSLPGQNTLCSFLILRIPNLIYWLLVFFGCTCMYAKVSRGHKWLRL